MGEGLSYARDSVDWEEWMHVGQTQSQSNMPLCQMEGISNTVGIPKEDQ